MGLYFRYINAGKSYMDLNHDAFEAQFYGTNVTMLESDNLLAFCGFNCSMLTIAAADNFNQAISPYYFQLTNGSCANIFESTNW